MGIYKLPKKDWTKDGRKYNFIGMKKIRVENGKRNFHKHIRLN